jgi:erythronate-4-phosphate dehydrogenase
LDHIDRDYLARKEIAFAYAPGANANSVVEYVLAAVAAVDDTLERLLAGGSVGIVGYGHIGRALASRLKALGIGYRVYDPWLDPRTLDSAADLDAVLDCDVISLHPELCMEQPWPSHHLLGQHELLRLRTGALLINASRGPVVDNGALLSRLQSAREPRAVLDVWEGEPNIDPALLACVTLGTAHIAGYSLDGKLLATRMLSDAVVTYLDQTARSRSAMSGAVIAQDLPLLRVTRDLSGANLARFLLQSRYDVRADDALLRQAVAGERLTQDRGNAFDRLRRSYRDRRELAGSAVECITPAQFALVRALGCTPVASVAPD